MMKAELDRMNAENEHLRTVLDEINGKYQSLKMHITSLMNHQHNPDAADQNKSADHKVFFSRTALGLIERNSKPLIYMIDV